MSASGSGFPASPAGPSESECHLDPGPVHVHSDPASDGADARAHRHRVAAVFQVRIGEERSWITVAIICRFSVMTSFIRKSIRADRF